jgi:sugar phosphate isomerase/epimerase
MKYAFMTFSATQMTIAELLETARKYGYSGLEPRVEQKHAHGIELETSAEQRKTIRKQVEDFDGVELACLATSCRYADPHTTQKQVDDTYRYIDLAADVGCPRLRIFGGDLPDDVSRKQAIELLVRSLRPCAEHAQSRGVTLCLETHDQWTHPLHVRAVLDGVNHPNLALNWDFWHPARASGWPIQKQFDTLGSYVKHVHFHDGLLRLDTLGQKEMGTGDLDVKLVVKLLKGMNYDGFLSGEWFGWDPHEHLPREINAMKAYEAEIG